MKIKTLNDHTWPKAVITFLVALAALIASSDAEAKPPTVIRAEARDTLQTHGLSPHLHSSIENWQTMAKATVDDVVPGEVWDLVTEISPNFYPGNMAFLLRVLVCEDICGHTIEPEDWEFVALPQVGEYVPAATAGTGLRHDILTRSAHWVVPEEATAGFYHVAFQVLFYNATYSQGTLVFFHPDKQFMSIIRHTGD